MQVKSKHRIARFAVACNAITIQLNETAPGALKYFKPVVKYFCSEK